MNNLHVYFDGLNGGCRTISECVVLNLLVHLFNPNASLFHSSARAPENYETRCPCSHFLVLFFREAVSMQRWVPTQFYIHLWNPLFLDYFHIQTIYALVKGLETSITSKAVCPTACLQPESLAELCQCYPPFVTALVQERCTSLHQKEKEMEKDENKSFLSLFFYWVKIGGFTQLPNKLNFC